MLICADSAFNKLTAWLAQSNLPNEGILPTKREFSDLLDMSGGDLRKALVTL